MSHNPETIRLLDKLKKQLGCGTDKEAAEHMGMTPQEWCNLKGKGLTKLAKGLIRELLKK